MNPPSDSRAPDPHRPPSVVLPTAGVLALVVLVGLALWLLSPAPEPERVPVPIAPAPASAGRPDLGLAGDAACRECHRTEFLRHRRSGHSHTLRPAAEGDLARWLDGRDRTDPEQPGTRWRYALRSGRLVVERTDEQGRSESRTLDYAFGSGRHATTFVALETAPFTEPTALEHRLTYFAADQTLDITPGQTAADLAGHPTDPFGLRRSAAEARQCFGCHTTLISDFGPRVLDPATMRPNLSCERCHGPGAAHVAAARRGEAELARTLPLSEALWDTDGQMRACGECHRHPDQAPPGQIRTDNPVIIRFQPVGLMQSRCYTESDGGLRCTTCHDPHAPSSSDHALYESICLRCHVPDHAKAAPCPVSPRSDCLNCHMPAVEAGVRIRFTDHWIRIRAEGSKR